MEHDKIITRSFVIRGLKLHELKAVIQDYEEDGNCLPGQCIVEDLIITFRDDKVLCVFLGSIQGFGSNRRIQLNDDEFDQFKFIVNRLAR